MAILSGFQAGFFYIVNHPSQPQKIVKKFMYFVKQIINSFDKLCISLYELCGDSRKVYYH